MNPESMNRNTELERVEKITEVFWNIFNDLKNKEIRERRKNKGR